MTKSKAATLEKHRFLCFVVALALVAATVMSLVVPRVVRAATSEEGITGKFTIGNEAPIITEEPTLYDSSRNTTVTQMTPQVEYAVKVTVADTGTLGDLTSIEVTIFYDADGEDTNNAEERAADTQTAFVMTWTENDTNPVWSQNPNTNTTWDLVETNCEQPSLSGGSGTFWFHFKPGKVATEATDWDVYVKVTDDGNQTDTFYDAGDYDMLWYGEIDVLDNEVNWGTVLPGMDFNHANAKESVRVKYISNGDYDAAVSTDNWGGAILNAGGNPGPNQFSLKAWFTDNLTAAKLVTTNPDDCVIETTGTQTGESGRTNNDNTLYLKLGTPFVDALYQGTITFYIRNR